MSTKTIKENLMRSVILFVISLISEGLLPLKEKSIYPQIFLINWKTEIYLPQNI